MQSVLKLNVKSEIVVIVGFLVMILVMSGCTPQEQASDELSFEDGLDKLTDIYDTYESTHKQAPEFDEWVTEELAELLGLRASTQLEDSFAALVDHRIALLEAELLHREGWQWGPASSTDVGFGCKGGFERIINSSTLRIAAADRGEEAADLLSKFVEQYPDQADMVGFTAFDATTLNATYIQIEEKAERDERIVRNLCTKDE